MSPGTYYRKAAAANNQNLSPQHTPTSLSKRRNSHTPSLSLSPAQGPSSAASSVPALASRKPPAYPGTPSSGPVAANGGRASNTTPTPNGRNASPGGSVNSTPPGTPSLMPTLPRPMMLPGGHTPALAPDRSVTVTTAGVTRVVRAKDLREHMDLADEVVLPQAAVATPPAAAPKTHRSMVDTEAATKAAGAHRPSTIVSGASTAAMSMPSIRPDPSPIVPVKHLVKLTTLSSLASLIAPPGSPSPRASAHSAGGSPMSASPRASKVYSSTPPPPPTFIILDIDETIHVNAHSPCLMMCEKGLEMYQKIISTHQNYRNVSYAQKSERTKTLQAALQSKRTVETNTGELLNQLQAASQHGPDGTTPRNNIKIFGLTARYSHMASTTRKELLKLSIDLEKSSPFPMTVRKKAAHAAGWNPNCPSPMNDRSLTPSPNLSPSATPLPSSPIPPLALAGAAQSDSLPYFPDLTWHDHPAHGTDAKYSQGVIYTNACEKGPVLSRFLSFLWQKIEEDNAEILEAQQMAAAAAAAANIASPTSAASNSDDEASQASMPNSRAVSEPITIGGDRNLSPLSSVTPSPPEPNCTLSLLAAASKAASSPRASGPAHKKRRDSRNSSIHLGLPGHDAMSPIEPDTPPTPPHQAIPEHINHLPARIIFIDDRLQNCLSVYESLSASTLLNRFYNGSTRHHVPPALEVYTCHYVAPELNHDQPTNQTKLDAANNPEPVIDLDLISCQIHHFLTHGEILQDSKGRAMVEHIKSTVRNNNATNATAAVTAAGETQQPLHTPLKSAPVVPASDVNDVCMEDANRDSMPADVPMAISTPRAKTVTVQ